MDDAIEVRADLLVDDDDIGTSFGKIIDKLFRVGNHQVRLKGEVGAAAYRLDDERPHGEVGDEMSVHNVDLDALGTCRVGFTHLVAQARKIGG